MLRLGSFVEQCGPDCRKLFTDFDTMRAEIHHVIQARKNNLPLWADSAGGPHNYGSFSVDEPERSKRAIF
jgi:hypothetical protein